MFKSFSFWVLLILFLGVFFLIKFYFSGQITETEPKTLSEKLEKTDPIISQIAAMSLEEKLGQLLIVGFEHPTVDDHIKKMIIDYHIGGINLLKRNVESAEQTKKLIAELQALATIPLFIATDQEGGSFSRFGFSLELTPQAKLESVAQAEVVAFRRAGELKEMGVNMNFSPVLDYVSDPTSYLYSRTFATSSNLIAELGLAMIRGYRRGGVIPVPKHFPGYGNVKPDPHRAEAVLSHDDELALRLLPFRNLVLSDPGLPLMTAHIIVPSIDNKPATVSKKFLTDLLRNDWGFNGVIMTDEIEMVSVGEKFEELAVQAVQAGADIIISTYTPAKQIKIFDRLKQAIMSGEITESQLNESVKRVLNLKSQLNNYVAG